MMNIDPAKKIILDADVIIHFSKGGQLGILPQIFPNCRFHHDVIGSSNLKDIRLYCEENNIDYLTTMDFLAEAYHTNKLDEAACDFFIYNVKLKGSKLPCDSIAEYLNLK